MSAISPEIQKKSGFSKGHFALIFLAAIIMGLAYYSWPVWQQVPLNDTGEPAVYFMGELIDESVYYEEGELYLSFEFVQKNLDTTIKWDNNNRTAIITTSENVYHLPLGSKEGLQDLNPYSFTYPVVEKDGVIYLPADPLKDYYNLEIFENNEAMLVRIHDLKKSVQQGQVTSDVKIRLRNSWRSPWSAAAVPRETVDILKEADGWYWVETADGRMGYLNESKIILSGIRTPQEAIRKYPPWNPLERPVIMTWEYAGEKTANPLSLGEMEGLQAVSPTWFHLADEGLVINKADKKYVEWAHQKGMQVWGLFDNGFDPDLTHSFLNDAQLRIKVVKQLLSLAELYELDGINLDFENMFLKDREAFVQFARELAPLLHQQERMLTVDVTFHSLSENWSMCYDRAGLAAVADYLMIMGYDEHTAGSSKAGSVSSLPWVEKGIERMLEDVPADKLILGIPFYTRLWVEKTAANGEKELTSKAYSMEAAEKWIAEHGAQVRVDEVSGQHYAELRENDVLYRIWLEDQFSLTNRIALMKKYKLAGIAAWRRGFEKPEIWPLMSNLVKKVW